MIETSSVSLTTPDRKRPPLTMIVTLRSFCLIGASAAASLALAGCSKPAATASPAPASAAPMAATTAPAPAAMSNDRLCDLIEANFKGFLPPSPKRNTSISNTCTVGGGQIGEPRVAQVRANYSTYAGTTPDGLKFMRNNDPMAKDALALGAGSFSLLSDAGSPTAKLGITTAKNGRLLIIEVEPAHAIAPANADKALAAAKALQDGL